MKQNSIGIVFLWLLHDKYTIIIVLIQNILQKLVTPEYVVHYCKRGFNVRMLGKIESNENGWSTFSTWSLPCKPLGIPI